MDTRRKYPRYDFSQTGLAFAKGDMYRIHFTNISIGGVAFSHPKGMDVEIGDTIKVFAYERITDSMLALQVHIRHKSEDGKSSGGKLIKECPQFMDVIRLCQQQVTGLT